MTSLHNDFLKIWWIFPCRLQKSIDKIDAGLVKQETFDDEDIDDEDIEEDINDELDPVPIKKKQIIKCFMCINRKIYKDYTSDMGKT